MNQLDILYRALFDYRKQTAENRDLEKERAAIAKAGADSDVVEIDRMICTVEEDWIEAIEEGLVHVEKAIAEERQFIRSNGEVVPIEKVKRVGKESVEHLARHSNLLTKKPEGDDFIPDQLYTVERLSDFAVYENRFLYMMLCYLRDFISLRYNKITELTTTYNGRLTMNKSVSVRKQKLRYELTLVDERKDDWYLKEHNEAKEAISRIDLLLKAVVHYLNTPLMQEVAKAPMLKPPITKTNVLKMNKNFKGAMRLYEFLTAYDKPGYTAEHSKKIVNPFPEAVAEEFSETVALTSFLVYEHGLGLESFLKERYEDEEARRKEEEKRRLLEQIKSLQKRIRDSGESPEEYMLMLERRNRTLESDSVQLVLARQELERLNEEVATLSASVETLNQKTSELQTQLVNEKQKHEAEVASLTESYESKIAQMEESYREEISSLNTQLETERAEAERKVFEAEERSRKLEEELRETFRKMEEDLREELKKAEEELREEVRKHEEEFRAECLRREQEVITACRTSEEAARKECLDTVAKWELYGKEKDLEVARMENAKRVAESRMNAMRLEFGLIKDDREFIEQASFDELERQYKALKTLFRREWKKVKKEIRKEILGKIFHFKKKDGDLSPEAEKEKSETEGVERVETAPAPEKAKKEKKPKPAPPETTETEVAVAEEKGETDEPREAPAPKAEKPAPKKPVKKTVKKLVKAVDEEEEIGSEGENIAPPQEPEKEPESPKAKRPKKRPTADLDEEESIDDPVDEPEIYLE